MCSPACRRRGFAFTENIVYYARAIVYASQNIGDGDADAAVNQLVQLRGFWTSFGHPLFTIMTGLGVAIALRTRAKVIRVWHRWPATGRTAAHGVQLARQPVQLPGPVGLLPDRGAVAERRRST